MPSSKDCNFSLVDEHLGCFHFFFHPKPFCSKHSDTTSYNMHVSFSRAVRFSSVAWYESTPGHDQVNTVNENKHLEVYVPI